MLGFVEVFRKLSRLVCSAGICTQAIGCCCGGKLVLVYCCGLGGWARERCVNVFSSPLCRHTYLTVAARFLFRKEGSALNCHAPAYIQYIQYLLPEHEQG